MADFDQVATNEDIAAIADAIRDVGGTVDDMTIAQMPAKVRALQPSGNQDIETLDEYDVSHKATARVSAAERAKIVGSNIKQGVTILGVQGEYSQRNALPSVIDGSATELSPEDLQGASKIRQYAFYMHSSLKTVVLPDGLEYLTNYAFSACPNLESVVLGRGPAQIGPYCFSSCTKLTSVVFSDTITELSNYAFSGCIKLQSIVLPDTVTSIQQYALSNCATMKTIDIGTGLTYIAANAFQASYSLVSITIRAVNPPTLANYNAFSTTNSCPIYVPAGSVDAYKAATNWSTPTLASRIQAIPS